MQSSQGAQDSTQQSVQDTTQQDEFNDLAEGYQQSASFNVSAMEETAEDLVANSLQALAAALLDQESLKRAQELAEAAEEERKRKKKEEEEERKLFGRAYVSRVAFDLAAWTDSIINSVRDKSPEQITSMLNSTLPIPAFITNHFVGKIDISNAAMVAPFLSEQLNAVIKSIDKLDQTPSKPGDNPDTIAALKSASATLKELQQTLGKLATWNKDPKGPDQIAQNYHLLLQMQDNLAAINSNPLLKDVKIAKQINDAMTQKIEKEKTKLEKLDPQLKDTFAGKSKEERAALYDPNTKTPEQASKEFGQFAQLARAQGPHIPTALITFGINHLNANQLTQMLSGGLSQLDQTIKWVDKMAAKAGGNAETVAAYKDFSDTLKTAQQQAKDFAKSSASPEQQHQFLKQMQANLDKMNSNPLLKDAKQLKEVRKINTAMQKKIDKEISKLEKRMPHLKENVAVLSIPKDSPSYHEPDTGRYRLQMNSKNCKKICEKYAGETDGLRCSSKQGAIVLSDRTTGRPMLSVSAKDMSITVHDEKALGMVGDFVSKVAPGRVVTIESAKAVNAVQNALGNSGITSKQAEKPTARPTQKPAGEEPSVTQEQQRRPGLSAGPSGPR